MLAAKAMQQQLSDTQRGERFPVKDLSEYLPSTVGFTGVKRQTSDSIAYLLDSGRFSYESIGKALDDIIHNNGQENYAAAKRVELVLDDMLTNGYADVDGRPHGPNEAYIAEKSKIPGAEVTEAAPEADSDYFADLVENGYDAAHEQAQQRTAQETQQATQETEAERRKRESYKDVPGLRWKSVPEARVDELLRTGLAELDGQQGVGNDGEVADAWKYSIKETTKNAPFVEVEQDILAGVPEADWVKTVKENLKKKFPNGITVGNNEISIDGGSRREMTFSRYMQWLYNNDPQLHADKLRATNNADEILLATTDWVNEGLNHPRKDKIADFARGNVLLRVGGNDYTADVVVGTKKNGSMALYDVLNMQPTSFTEKEADAAISTNPSPGAARSTASVSNYSLRNSGENVNRKFSVSEDSQGRELSEAQQAYFRDSAVRDEDGRLMVMYHGTRAENGDFTVFDYSKAVKKGGLGLKALGKGNYFTSKQLNGTERFGNRVIEAYLNITNPFVYDGSAGDTVSLAEQVQKKTGTDTQGMSYDALQDAMRDLGYDGVIEYRRDGSLGIAVTFDSEQIKNVTNRNPTGDPDIRYSVTEDSQGRELSEAQQEYFKDSKAVDEEGRLLNIDGFYLNVEKKPVNLEPTEKNMEAYNAGVHFRETYGENTEAAWTRFFFDEPELAEKTVFYNSVNERYFNAGMRGELPQYRLAIRFGKIPENGRSKNWGTGELERGVSVVNFLNSKTQNEKTLYDYVYGMQGTEKTIVGGWDFGIYGTDGEPLLINPVTIAPASEINRIKLADNQNPTSDPDIRYSINEGKTQDELLDFVTQFRKATEERFREVPKESAKETVEDNAAAIRGDLDRLAELARQSEEAQGIQRQTPEEIAESKVNARVGEEKPGFMDRMRHPGQTIRDAGESLRRTGENVRDTGRYFYRKLVDSGEAVSRVGKQSGDRMSIENMGLVENARDALAKRISRLQNRCSEKSAIRGSPPTQNHPRRLTERELPGVCFFHGSNFRCRRNSIGSYQKQPMQPSVSPTCASPPAYQPTG